jgi:tetraacyldisaccharide 4'-kinase
LLQLLYSWLARARRRYYERRPHLRRRLSSPVISIGNLTVGGSGKTPLAAEIARMLIDMGERPSILSRGYARRIVEDGVVVVSDGAAILADVMHSGDEPQMLARAVPRAAVLVASNRYVAGRLAETRLGCTVHVLDDGFQHFDLARDVDLLVAPDAHGDTRTLPFGRLREPLDAAAAADAFLMEVPGADMPARDTARDTAAGARPTFEFSRRLGGPPPDRPAFAFAGIARPERFFADLERAGWRLTGQRRFADHHQYSAREIDDIVRVAEELGSEVILTTAKDFVRLRALGSDPRTGTGVRPQIVAVPQEVSLAPAYKPWLVERLRARHP